MITLIPDYPGDKEEAERRYPIRHLIVEGGYDTYDPLEAERAAYIAGREDERAALASSPPPAPAGERERLRQLARDESWRREYPKGVDDARRKTFISGAEFIIRALASEAGPTEEERP